MYLVDQLLNRDNTDNSEEGKKTKMKFIEFLKHDFSEPRWAKAARGNGAALESKHKPVMAASLYFLGGDYKSMVGVLTRNIRDIQLAVCALRLIEDPTGSDIEKKPLLKGLVEEHFVKVGEKVGDPWAVILGNLMLGKNVEAVNCCFKNYQAKLKVQERIDDSKHKTCDGWPGEFRPYLSSFHPSIILFANMMKESKLVKDELRFKNQDSDPFGLSGGGGMGLDTGILSGGFSNNNGMGMDSDLFGGDSGGGDLFGGGGGSKVVEQKAPDFEEDLHSYCAECFKFYKNVKSPWLGLIWNNFLLNKG